MSINNQELAQMKRFDAIYSRAKSPVMTAIERSVCGCDYGGNSWASRAEVEGLGAMLELAPESHFLDLGSGSGWPGLFVGNRADCVTYLLDLPHGGLELAVDRAHADGISDRVCIVGGDAGTLPFKDGMFDAINQSDLLCCLYDKRAVLEECRRVIRASGRMVFTVVVLAPGLSDYDYKLARDAGPEFIEAPGGYDNLVCETGWRIAGHRDLSDAFAGSCQRQLEADRKYRKDLAALVGEEVYNGRLAEWTAKLAAIRKGHLRREVFMAVPA